MKKDLKDVERRKAFRYIERAEKTLQAFGRALLGVAMECTSGECAQWHTEGKTQIMEDANIIPTLRIGKRMTSPRDLFLEWMNHQVGKNI